MAVAVDDWMVADSEDEDTFDQLPPANGSTATYSAVAGSPDASEIQTAVFTPDQPRTPPRGRRSPDGSLFTPPGGLHSTIGNFTSEPSTSVAPSAMAPKPRPRPRPRVVMKKPATSDPIPNTSFSHISDPPISATRQTDDSIHPATATSLGFSDVVDDTYSSFGIAERAKMRSRKSQTANTSIPPVRVIEVIELTSDEDDELALKPTKRQKKQSDPVPKSKAQTKPRPKPTLKTKPATVLPSGSSPSPTVIQGPPGPPAQCTPSSQLPASTLPTVPPSTPPQARELTPLSSPLVTTRKRKRMRLSIAEDEDEMDIIGGNPTEISPSFPMPPPFFAPSSSSVPTDSGIEIPPVESLSARGKKKQVPSGKKGTQKKPQNKGKKGKKGEMTSAMDEMVDESVRLSQEPSTPATRHGPSFTRESPSPVVRNSTATKKVSGKQTVTKKGKARAIDSCEEEDDPVLLPKSNAPADEGEGQISKENLRPDDLSPKKRDPPPKHTPTPGLQVRDTSVKPKLTPMSELIRRANSQPSSPFPNVSRIYSPLLKSSRTMLSRIAPLHPNRRTPPPPLPRPPPPKKSKKQLEMEERIEEELAETIDGWSCLTDDERKALRKARIDVELGYE
ncbi:hypothetical protein OG21DRAFT_1484513 [Imleria badia]|nr:hypothetical protein OG21DRAFT_1484513 [Imleria badia]